MTDVVSWVIGRGGLLGRGVESALSETGAIWHPPTPFEWQNPDLLFDELSVAAAAFAHQVGDSPWQVAWCAGAGVVGSDADELGRETAALTGLLALLGQLLMGPGRATGGLFLASSAGGVYAGSGPGPFSESSAVRPLAPYGENKLRQESLAREWSSRTGTPVLIGRISNLYGPGQNISKNQGLITTVCRRVLARQPLVLYMPLDTIRDYCYVRDASRLVAEGLDRLRRETDPATSSVVVKVIASQQPTTIGAVLAQVRSVTRRPVRVMIAPSANARRQAPDLRMISTVWPELDEYPLTTISAGLKVVVNELLDMAGRGVLASGGLGGG